MNAKGKFHIVNDIACFMNFAGGMHSYGQAASEITIENKIGPPKSPNLGPVLGLVFRTIHAEGERTGALTSSNQVNWHTFRGG